MKDVAIWLWGATVASAIWFLSCISVFDIPLSTSGVTPFFELSLIVLIFGGIGAFIMLCVKFATHWK